MANVFKDISQFTLKSAATGTEEFQVSATEKVTATQIANKVQLNQVLMSGFGAVSIKGVEQIKDTNSLLGALKILYSLSGNGRVKVIGNSEHNFGLVSINTAGTLAFGILFDIRSSTPPSIFIRDGFGLTGGASLKDLTDNQWIAEMKKGKKIPMESDIRVVEITDFAIPGLNITKDGESFLFYANDASNIPNSNHGATSFVGVAIASPIFITGDQRLLYYMMIDTAKAMFYTGYANLEDDTVTWSDTPVTRLGQAVQVTAFTEAAFGALLYSYKPGDFIPFYTSSVMASEANQFPESGIFNGFISMGSNEGDYFQIFAFKSGSNKAYLGACIGSTTQWTQIGGSSAVEKLSTWLEQGTEVAPHINISLGEVQVPLNRALKESDILRIDFMRRSEASTFYMQGVAIVHVGAVDNSIQGYAAALDEQYVDYGTGEFAALAFNASTKLIGHNYFNLHIDTNGSVPQDDYYIMGVYNISGK